MHLRKINVLFAVFIFSIFIVLNTASGEPGTQLPSLGRSLPSPKRPIDIVPKQKAEADFTKAADNYSGYIIDTLNRSEVLNFYNNVYLASEKASINWTGNHDTCNAGNTAQEYKNAIMRRINYFRAMAGIPANIHSSELYNTKAQAAALMMAVNNKLDHYPTTDWTCYSANGAEAASNSNLYLGVFGPDAVDGYIRDPGAGNYSVGHRRWLLYPQTEEMGTGDVPRLGAISPSNALWVMDDNYWNPRPETRDYYVAWPPPGYVPYQVVYPRWSFSYPNADFSKATVNMTSTGISLPITLEPLGSGPESTLVWLSLNSYNDWPVPDIDTTYTVTIDNVSIDGLTKRFVYNVTVMDMSATPPPPPTNSKHSILSTIILLLSRPNI